MTLVDTNVLLDVISSDPVWGEWSTEQLRRCHASGGLWVNEIGYAELAGRMETEGDLALALKELDIGLSRASATALFLAGKAFRRYRDAGGPRLSLLPDFFIGAHAQTTGMPILTRDVRRYRTYFPRVELIAPSE